MALKKYFSKSIAAILSVATLLTTVSPCTSAKNNLPDKKNTSGMSTAKKAAIGAGAIALGLATFMAYEHYKYKSVYIKDLSEEDQKRWRAIYGTIHSIDLHPAIRTNDVFKKFDDDSNYKNPKLLNARDEPNKRGKTLLMYAARHGLADVCEKLIKHGANVNIGWEYGTPLHEAALCSFFVSDLNNQLVLHNHRISDDAYVATCECLLRHGANVNAKDYFGETPLHYAGRGGSLEVINLLINNGADITAKDNLGRTPLRKCTVEDVRCALEDQRAKKVKPNTTNN